MAASALPFNSVKKEVQRMYCVKKLKSDLWWVGASDRKLALFEGQYPIPRGVSYNAYVLMDEKTVLLDTVDSSVSDAFLENLAYVLGDRKLDYLVVNHMEPDHCATVEEVVLRHPEVTLVCNQKTVVMLRQFFGSSVAGRVEVVDEKSTLNTGRHILAFVMAPMVHWPEAMMTYDSTDKTLFSADAFGSFGALNGHLFADEVDFENEWLPDARRYYTNIVGKYGAAVQTVLKKAAMVPIEMVCPLHGPVWRENLGWIIDKYSHWAACEPEEKGVVIAYASVYGHTANAAQILAMKLADAGVRKVRLYDVSTTHVSELVAEAFHYSHLVFAAPTVDGGAFPAMDTLLHHLAAHALHDRTVAFVENGSWAPMAARRMEEALSPCKDMTVLKPVVTLKSSLDYEGLAALDSLVAAIAEL